MFNEVSPYLTAFVIGLLIGIERERSKNKEGLKSIMGVRTLPLIGLIGCLLASTNSFSFLWVISIFISLIIFVNEVHWDKKTQKIVIGSTSAVASVIVFILGYLAYTNRQLAVILGVIVFMSLAIKNHLHSFARNKISQQEMSAAVTFLVSAFVILPLLPDDFIDPWGLIHPTRIWLLFVLIAGVQFFSYIALLTIGNKWGMLLSGLLGGFISSTATTMSLAMKAKKQPEIATFAASAIILAEVSSLLIQVLVLSVMISEISIKLSIVLAIPAGIGVIMALIFTKYVQKNTNLQNVEINLDNPISLKRTLIFAFLISLGLILIALAEKLVGEVGVYVTSALGGFASMRIVTFSVTELFNSDEIVLSVAVISILTAMIANILMKLAIIKRAGSSKVLYISILGFLPMIASGVLVYFFYP
jgi:uncharacterized membrane protein (DUF4010 family)